MNLFARFFELDFPDSPLTGWKLGISWFAIGIVCIFALIGAGALYAHFFH